MTLFWFVIPLHLLLFGWIFLVQFDHVRKHTTAMERSLGYILGLMFLVSDIYTYLPISFQYFHLSDFGLIENIEVALAFVCTVLLFVLFSRIRSGKRYAYLFFSFIFFIICLEEIRYGTVFFSHFNDTALTDWHKLLITLQESAVWDVIVDILLFILQITSFFILVSPGLSLADYSNPHQVPHLFASGYGGTWGWFRALLRLLLAAQLNFALYLVPASMSCASSEFQQLTYLLSTLTCLGFWTFRPLFSDTRYGDNASRKSKAVIKAFIRITIAGWLVLWMIGLLMQAKNSITISFEQNTSQTSQCINDLTADHLTALPEDEGIRIYGMLNNLGDEELEDILIGCKVLNEDGRIIAHGSFVPFNGAPAAEKIEVGKSRFFYGAISTPKPASRVELVISDCRVKTIFDEGWRSHTE